MRPILFEVFGMPVFGYGFMVAVAFVVGYLIVLRRVDELKMTGEQLADFALLLAIAGVVGARILFVLINWSYYSAQPLAIFDLRAGGLSFHGGAIAAIVLGIWFVRRHHLSVGRIADAVAPAFALGISLVRLGCLLNGCCYGLPAELPWAFDCSYVHDVARHPTQIYESLAMVGVFLFLLKSQGHRRFPGFLLVLFTVQYSVVRFGVEFFRDVPEFWASLSMAQVASILFAGIGLIWIFAAERAYRSSAEGRVQG